MLTFKVSLSDGLLPQVIVWLLSKLTSVLHTAELASLQTEFMQNVLKDEEEWEMVLTAKDRRDALLISLPLLVRLQSIGIMKGLIFMSLLLVEV